MADEEVNIFGESAPKGMKFLQRCMLNERNRVNGVYGEQEQEAVNLRPPGKNSSARYATNVPTIVISSQNGRSGLGVS